MSRSLIFTAVLILSVTLIDHNAVAQPFRNGDKLIEAVSLEEGVITVKNKWVKVNRSTGEFYNCTQTRKYERQQTHIEEAVISPIGKARAFDEKDRSAGEEASDDINRIHNSTQLYHTFMKFRNEQKQYHPVLYAGVRVIPSLGYRTVNINQPMSLHALDQQRRRDREFSTPRGGASVQAGILFTKNLTVYCALNYLNQGFITDSQSINWTNGLPETSQNADYKFSYMGAELGVRFSGDRRKINGVLESGVYLHREQSKETYGNVISARTRQSIMGVKVATGLNWRPHYRFEVLLLPTVYYNITPTNRGELNTRLFNGGITIGAGWYFICPKAGSK